MLGLHLKIAICDDEETVRRTLVTLIAKYIDKHDFIVDISEFSSGEDFLAADPDSFHLVFLDVCMGGINGFGTAKILWDERISFTSASKILGVHSKYVRTMRYLVKPLEEEQVFSVLNEFFYIDIFLPY